MSINLSIFTSRVEHFSSSEFFSLSRSLYDCVFVFGIERDRKAQVWSCWLKRKWRAGSAPTTYGFVEVALLLDGVGQLACLVLPNSSVTLCILCPGLPVEDFGFLERCGGKIMVIKESIH
jgi:hypothetical protein